MHQSSFHHTTDAEQKAQTVVAAATIFERGQSLRLAGRTAEAVRILRRGLAEKPDDYRLHDELGTALCELKRYEEAIGSFMAALRFKPDFDEACNKIGRSFASRGMLEPAVLWFERARQLNPATSQCLHSFGTALVLLGRLEQAAEVFEQWTHAEPDNPIARHLANAALGSQATTKASAEYVRTLFDGCAARFDGNLSQLQYRGPQLIAGALQQAAEVPAEGWNIVDVGCGTGLVGVHLRPIARRLTGVDLSPGMLNLARQRGIYDELIEADMIEYLRNHSQGIDVLSAADVLTYVGDLSEFFHSAAQALQVGGLIAVAVEALQREGTYRLNPTGRFSHNSHYLRNVMETSGLTVIDLREDVMRCEASRPVPTLVAAGSKNSAV